MDAGDASERSRLLGIIEKDGILSSHRKYHAVRYIVERDTAFPQLKNDWTAPDSHRISIGRGIISCRFAQLIAREGERGVDFLPAFRFVLIGVAEFEETAGSEQDQPVRWEC